MADVTLVAQSYRDGARLSLTGTKSNIDGDQVATFGLPANVGDIWLENVMVVVTTIATVVTTPELLGVGLFIVDDVSTGLRDPVGRDRWQKDGASRLVAFADLNHSTVWRYGENLAITFAEVDTNVAPTADLQVLVRGLRLRN